MSFFDQMGYDPFSALLGTNTEMPANVSAFQPDSVPPQNAMGGVPLPRSRPPEAGPPMMSPQPMGDAGMPMQGGAGGDVLANLFAGMRRDKESESRGGSGFLGELLGLDPDRARSLRRGIAGGLTAASNSAGKSPMQAFAGGMGGAITGAENSDDRLFDQKSKLISTAITARKNDDLDAYRAAMTQIRALDAMIREQRAGTYQQRTDEQGDYNNRRATTAERRADTYQQGTNDRRDRPGTWNKSPHQIRVDADRVVDRTFKPIQPSAGMTPEQRSQLAQDNAAERKRIQEEVYQRYGVQPHGAAPAGPRSSAPPAASPASSPPEIDMQGNGTRQQPYRVMTPADHEEIPSGAYYMHPDGSVRVKK